MPSLCVVAGDPSGDAHAARLLEALRARLPGLSGFGLGGPALQRAGLELLEDLTAAAAIGPFDAIRHLARLRRAVRRLDERLRRQRPDLVLLVDFGDFNLPVIAPLVKRYGLPIGYYISPQLWAWGRFRLRLVRRYVDRMIVLFPFEVPLYERAGVPVTWVGHPLVDTARPACSIEEARARCGLNAWRMTLGLLPGSRASEVRRHLPLLLQTAAAVAWHMPGVEFVIPRAPSIPRETLERALARRSLPAHVAEGPAADTLQLMDAAVVTSGTATLEAALCGVPMVVVYRTSWPTYVAARAVLRIPRIALVNVVAQQPIVPEFVQHRAQPARVANRLVELLRDDEQRAAMRKGFRMVRDRLGPSGAVARAADAVMEMIGRARGAAGTSSAQSRSTPGESGRTQSSCS